MSAFPDYLPLLDLIRNDLNSKEPAASEFIDQRFFGIIVLYGFSDGEPYEIARAGEDNGYPFFLRSLLKPLQASVLAEFNTSEYFGFTPSELAVMQASHCGEKQHRELVLSILKKTGLDETYLKCPPDKPLSPFALAENEAVSAVCNNCSGKHAMMLALSKQLGYSLSDYFEPAHPLQKLILKQVEELSGFNNPPQTLDGCGVPVYALPLKSIAKAFFKLYNDEKYRFLRDAYCLDPYISGGRDVSGLRQDTHIMKLNPELISKTGAGGFLSIYNRAERRFLLVKMAQDNNFARNLLTMRILGLLGWINYSPDYNHYTENHSPAGVYRVPQNVCKMFLPL